MKTLEEIKTALENIPDEKWAIGSVDFDGKCCLLGHLGNIVYQNSNHGVVVARHFDMYDVVKKVNCLSIGYINDGKVSEYNQKTPKARSLAFIDDVIKNRNEMLRN